MNLLDKMNMNLLGNKGQAPSLIELPAPNIPKPNNKTLVTKDSPSSSTLSFSRKKPAVQQTPAEIVSEVVKQNKATEAFVQCQFLIQDESNNYLEAPISKQISLTPEELEELLIFAEQVEQRRRKQEKEQQERRSWKIAKKITTGRGGTEFLSEHSIACLKTPEGKEEWCQNLLIVKSEDNQEEISQPLNFYTPQHSWILESWLSQQAVSWTVRRYCPSPEQVIYQVSFGFPDQTFLEAEGPTREGAILAVAEDLLGD